MKIKLQLTILIAGIISVPVLCVVAMLAFRYISSPQRILIKSYEKAALEQNLSHADFASIKSAILKLPPDVEIAVFFNKKLVFSSIKDISNKDDFDAVIDYIKDTNRKYFYQISGVQSSTNNGEYTVITRLRKRRPARPLHNYFIGAFATILALTEVFAITVVLLVFKNIRKSIMILEENAQKIASGDLNTQIKVDSHDTNEIVSLTDNLEKMRLSLMQNLERRNKFIMGISHDLRTPVALIKGYTEGILDGVIHDSDKVHESLQLINAKNQQLSTLIDNLINFVKLDNNDWQKNLKTVVIKPILEDFASSVNVAQAVFLRTVKINIEVGENTKVQMDTMLFTRALENLYSNALRYTKEHDEIAFSAKEENNNLIIAISDTGEGIKQEDLDRIFDLFYRGTQSRREEGYGIGLSVVKSIIEAHGWKIFVKSQVGSGTTFTIQIPLALA